MKETPGFAVVYRWQLRADKESQFRAAWERVTTQLMKQRDALGSRLHRCDNGEWMAYAQWPTRDHWTRSNDQGSVDPDASSAMHDAIARSYDPIPLTVELDHLA